MKASWRAWLGGLGLFLLLGVEARAEIRLPEGDLFYHWQHRLSINEGDRRVLGRLDLAAGLVNGGRFLVTDGKPTFEPTGTARDLSSENFPWAAHAVYLFGGSFRNWLAGNAEAAEAFVTKEILKDLPRWKRRPVGVQFDLEGPAAILPAYARFLRTCRGHLPADLIVSCVSMTHWFTEPALHEVLASVDFFVPMLYNLGWGTRFAHEVEVSDPRWIWGLGKRLEVFGKPYWVGVPTFSFCMCYEPDGKRRFGWHHLSLSTLSSHPDLEHLNSRPNLTNLRVGTTDITRLANGLPLGEALVENADEYAGDNVYTFRARRDLSLGSLRLSAGSFVVFNRVTSAGFAQYLQAVRRVDNSLCRGAAVFRYGKDGDDLALGVQAWADAYGLSSLHEARLDLKVDVEGEGKLRVRLANVGRKESFLSRDAVGVDLLFEGLRPTLMARGGFRDLRVETFPDGRSRLRLLHRYLEPGRVLESGDISLEPTGASAGMIRYRAWMLEADRMERRSDGRLVPVRRWIPSREGGRRSFAPSSQPWARRPSGQAGSGRASS